MTNITYEQHQMSTQSYNLANPVRRTIPYCIFMVVLTLGACTQLPPDYSPGYVRIRTSSYERPGQVRNILVPESCLVPDATDTQFPPRLPPGCANAANLEAMAERESDLVRGRRIGSAPAAPAARAAQNYIYGGSATAGVAVGKRGMGGHPATADEQAPPSNPAQLIEARSQ